MKQIDEKTKIEKVNFVKKINSLFKSYYWYVFGLIIIALIITFLIEFVDLSRQIGNLQQDVNSIFSDESSDDLEINQQEEKEFNQEVAENEALEKIDQNISKEEKEIVSSSNKNKHKKNTAEIVSCKNYIELLSAVFELQTKIIQGESFQKELLMIEVKSGNDKKILNYLNRINKYAESGVPDTENLKEEFNSIENDLILAYWVDNHQKNWKMYLRQFLSKFVFIKKIGQRAIRSGGIEMIIENVNEALDSNDLDNAVSYVKKIDGEVPRSIVAIWLEHVNNYIEVNEQVQLLKNHVMNEQNCLTGR